MKKLSIIFIVLTLAFSVYAAQSEKSLKKHHKDVAACIDCHGEANPVTVKNIDCSGCHSTPQDMAQQTASLGHKNPHTSIHWRETVPCETCHQEHRESINYCTMNCHNWPDVKPR